MRIKNKELKQRRHRKEQKIKEAQRDLRKQYEGKGPTGGAASAKPKPAATPKKSAETKAAAPKKTEVAAAEKPKRAPKTEGAEPKSKATKKKAEAEEPE